MNENFRDPDVEQFVQRFESESREVYALRQAVVASLGLKPGMSVADIGAGTGLYTILFAREVGPDGAVYAVDIAPNFLKYIAERSDEEGLTQVCPVLCTQTSAKLPPNSIDVAFTSDTYHHFENPSKTLESIHRSLRADGVLYVIDFDRRDGAREFILEHVRAPKEVFFSEIEAAGFEQVEVKNPPRFVENFFAKFRKVEEPSTRSGVRSTPE